jgi:1-deoxy-D-xylulose-5-phosphate synthase
MARGHELLVTVEENVLSGGAGAAVNALLHARRQAVPVLNIGLPDAFVEQGPRDELLALCGLDEAGILRQIDAFLG